jgi:hypothetical protein
MLAAHSRSNCPMHHFLESARQVRQRGRAALSAESRVYS